MFFGTQAYFDDNGYKFIVVAWILWLIVYVVILELITFYLQRTDGGSRRMYFYL